MIDEPESHHHQYSHHSNYTLLHWVLTRRGQALKAPFLRCSACADGLERQVAFTIRRRSIACYLGDLYKENWEDSLPSWGIVRNSTVFAFSNEARASRKIQQQGKLWMYRHIPSSTRKWFAISRKAKLLIAIQDANAFLDSPLERLETSMAIDKNSRHTGSLFEGIGWCCHCSGARDKLTLTRYSRPTMTAKQQCHGSPQAAKSKKVWQRILSEDTRPSSAVKHYNHWQILWWSLVLHILIDCG